MITADDDPIDDTVTDLNGINISECQANSKITNINIRGSVLHVGSGTRVIAILQKIPDGTSPATLSAVNWLSEDMSQAARDFKRNILWRTVMVAPADRLLSHFRIRLSLRSNALRRLGKMEDGDAMSLRFFNTAPADHALTSCYGTIITRR